MRLYGLDINQPHAAASAVFELTLAEKSPDVAGGESAALAGFGNGDVLCDRLPPLGVGYSVVWGVLYPNLRNEGRPCSLPPH